MHRLFGNFVTKCDLGQERGSALLEFAITLPLLVVFLVGIYDFSGAFNQKQKIEQAAQEGAIVAGAQPMSDIDPNTQTPPGPVSLQPVVAAILNSLTGANVILQDECSSSTPHHDSAVQWTYTFSGCPLTITINRGLTGGAGTVESPATVGTEVTVSYPYQWRFNSVIQLLVPGAQYAATTNLTETATVHNQT